MSKYLVAICSNFVRIQSKIGIVTSLTLYTLKAFQSWSEESVRNFLTLYRAIRMRELTRLGTFPHSFIYIGADFPGSWCGFSISVCVFVVSVCYKFFFLFHFLHILNWLRSMWKCLTQCSVLRKIYYGDFQSNCFVVLGSKLNFSRIRDGDTSRIHTVFQAFYLRFANNVQVTHTHTIYSSVEFF